MNDSAPLTFGKFRLSRLVSQVGLVQTYVATIDGMGGFVRPCFVTRLDRAAAAHPSAVERFVRQARQAARYSHPNITHAFDFGQIDDEFFVASEYVDSLPLEALLLASRQHGRTAGPRLAVHLGKSLCDALDYIERTNLAANETSAWGHLLPRDIVISCDRLDVKLSLFEGMGTRESDVRARGDAAQVYRPREVRDDAPAESASAAYAVAAMIYELACGAIPTARAGLAGVTPPSELVPGFPTELERVLMKALSVMPAERFISPVALGSELGRLEKALQWTQDRREVKEALVRVVPEWAAKLDSVITVAPPPSAPLPLGADKSHVSSSLLSTRSRRKRRLRHLALGTAIGAAVSFGAGFLLLAQPTREAASEVKVAQLSNEQAKAVNEHRLAGLTAMDEGDYAAAAKAFEAAAAIDPKSDCAELAKMARGLAAKPK